MQRAQIAAIAAFTLFAFFGDRASGQYYSSFAYHCTPVCRPIIHPTHCGIVIPPPGSGTVIPPPGSGTVIPPPGQTVVIPPPGSNPVVIPPPGSGGAVVIPVPGSGSIVVPPGGGAILIPPPGGAGTLPPPGSATRTHRALDRLPTSSPAKVVASRLSSRSGSRVYRGQFCTIHLVSDETSKSLSPTEGTIDFSTTEEGAPRKRLVSLKYARNIGDEQIYRGAGAPRIKWWSISSKPNAAGLYRVSWAAPGGKLVEYDWARLSFAE